MDTDLKRPEPRLKITFKGEPRVLFMSYLRQNSCLRVLGEPENLQAVLVDPNISEMVLQVMLAEKAGAGKMFETALNEDDLEYEDVDRILEWVMEHLTYFFMRRFQMLGEQTKNLGPTVTRLQSSLNGSELSSSSEASAGPSE